MIKSFTSTAFQRNPADVFNAVQANGMAKIAHKARPRMIVMLESQYREILNGGLSAIEIANEAIGDSHLQDDLLK